MTSQSSNSIGTPTKRTPVPEARDASWQDMTSGMAEDELRDAIDAAVREPRAWLFEADRLKRAADLVGTRFQAEANTWLWHVEFDESEAERQVAAFALAPVYLMLAGYAIEDLAKGLIVSSDPNDIAWVTSNHLSAEMMCKADVEPVGGEADLVDRLGHRVRWAGRYPAPRIGDARAFADTVRERGWWGNPMRASPGDVAMVNALFDRMRRQLHAAVSTMRSG